MLDDRKAQTQTTVLTDRIIVDPIKLIKYSGELIWCDADTGIPDSYSQTAGLMLTTNADDTLICIPNSI